MAVRGRVHSLLHPPTRCCVFFFTSFFGRTGVMQPSFFTGTRFLHLLPLQVPTTPFHYNITRYWSSDPSNIIGIYAPQHLSCLSSSKNTGSSASVPRCSARSSTFYICIITVTAAALEPSCLG